MSTRASLPGGRWARPGSPQLAAVAVAVCAAISVAVGAATPAGADPAVPTDYRSEVRSASPPLPEGVSARVVGGDAFLELEVRDGHEVIVPDYRSAGSDAADADPAPYLRFRADGTVERNRHAAATAANESRYGTSATTPSPGTAPQWETVATDGTYAWHDHRIHWMSPRQPRAVGADGRVDLGGPDGTWQVPLVVDGTATVLTGTLSLTSPPSPWPWALAALAAGAATWLAARRFGPRGAGIAGVLASAGALAVAVVGWQSIPADAGRTVVPVAVTAVALVAAVVSVVAAERFRARLVAQVAVAATLVGWSVLRGAVLTHAVLPTALAAPLDRAATAVAFGVGVALAVLAVWDPDYSQPDRLKRRQSTATASAIVPNATG